MHNPNAIISSDYGPIIINLNDRVIGQHIKQFGYWAKDDIRLIQALLAFQLQRSDSVMFYDVGANIGTHTLALAKLFPGQIKIRAFEAQRQIYHMLCGTMAINGLAQVWCHHHAVGSDDHGLLTITLPDYHSTNNFGGLELMPPINTDNQDVIFRGTEQVSTRCLDSFDEAVDFIKMDIEGMEDQALRGAQKAITTHRPICFIEIQKTDVAFVFNYFKNLNYFAYVKGFDFIAVPMEDKVQTDSILQPWF